MEWELPVVADAVEESESNKKRREAIRKVLIMVSGNNFYLWH
jgi:hypothetical protein